MTTEEDIIGNEYGMEINRDELCRICLVQGKPNLKSLFLFEIVNGAVVQLNFVVERSLGIRVQQDDDLPTRICNECKLDVNRFYTFKAQSLDNQKLLRTILKLPGQEEEYVQREEVSTDNKREGIFKDESNEDFIILKFNENKDQQNPEFTSREVEDVIVIDGDDNNPENKSQDKYLGHSIEENINEDIVELVSNKFQGENCKLCFQKFNDECSFKRHNKIHELVFSHFIKNTLFYSCAECLYTVLDPNLLISHFNCIRSQCSKYNALKSLVVNLNSNKYFPDDFVLPRICRISKPKQDSVFKCSLCNKIESTLESLMEHYKNVHDQEELELESYYRCSICRDVLFNGLDIKIHFYIQHRKNYLCVTKACGKFKTFQNQMQHQMICSSIDLFEIKNQPLLDSLSNFVYKVFDCNYCDKKYSSASSLSLHVRSHSNNKPFCKICGKTFNQNGDLTIHLRIHTGERPFKCNLCSKSFKTFSQKNDHLSTHTNDRQFHCVICKKQFKALRILKMHMKLHDQNKAYKCSICSKIFGRKTNFSRHMLKHK